MFAATKSFFAKAPPSGGGPTPAWTLDFSSGSFSGATLTRASSGTYVDSSGYIASASTDVARLTHDSSGNRLGLLVEGSRTNLCIRSEEFSNAAWTKFSTTVTADTVSAPDNQTTADELIESSATGAHAIYRSFSGSSSTAVITYSVYVKKGGRQYVGVMMYFSATIGRKVIFDLDNGTVSDSANIGSPTSTGESITSVGNGWYRLSVTGNGNGTGYQPTVFTSDRATFTGSTQFEMPSFAGNTGIVGAYLWGAQVEAGSLPTSYVATTTASVTRSADLAHVLDSSITSWGDPGALVIHFYPPGQAGTLLSTDDAAAEQLGLQASSTTAARAFWQTGDTSTGTITSGVNKAVHYWNGTASSFCINGGSVATGTNDITTFGNIDFVTFGAEATDSSGSPGTFSQWPNLVIRKIEFYAGTLSSGDLQTITT